MSPVASANVYGRCHGWDVNGNEPWNPRCLQKGGKTRGAEGRERILHYWGATPQERLTGDSNAGAKLDERPEGARALKEGSQGR